MPASTAPNSRRLDPAPVRAAGPQSPSHNFPGPRPGSQPRSQPKAPHISPPPAAPFSGRPRSRLQGSTAQPTRFPEVLPVLDLKKEKTLQTSSNSYPLISIASERWIDSMEITSFPFSCCISTPSNPCRQPPLIRTRCPVCTNG